jgi:hypothetical protein
MKTSKRLKAITKESPLFKSSFTKGEDFFTATTEGVPNLGSGICRGRLMAIPVQPCNAGIFHIIWARNSRFSGVL